MKTAFRKLQTLFKGKTLPFLLAAIWTLTFTGCTTDVEDPKLPEASSKLVVVSFISPEDPEVKVSVTRSVSLLSQENTGKPLVVPDAVVLLSDGKDTVQLPFIFNRSLYATSNFPIKPGKQYWLQVTSASGLQAEATCTVPAKRNQSLTARLDSSQFNTDFSEREYATELKWQDLPGEGDYYKVDASLAISGEFTATDTTFENIEMADEPLTRDHLADGRNFTIRSFSIYNYPDYQKNGRLQYMQTYLLTTNKPMYEFHRSLLRYQLNNSFTDPVKLYSNIKGGFGVFGAYRKFSLKVPV